MKKILLQILDKYFDLILSDWQSKLNDQYENLISGKDLSILLNKTLKKFMGILRSIPEKVNEKSIVDLYNILKSARLDLWHVSQIFVQGQCTLITYIEKEKKKEFDPVILIGFLNQGMVRIFYRLVMLYQESIQKEYSQDKEKLLQKLEINQRYLKSLLYGTDSAIMIIDENEKFIAWNKGAEAIFGYRENEILGKDSSFLLPDNNYGIELKKIQEAVSSDGMIKITETERKAKDGRLIPVTLTVTKLEGENGTYGGRSVIINDVSEVKTLQRQVDQSEKLAVIGQLAAGVAHEIGNPLTSISSVVQLLQRKSEDKFFITQLAIIKENIDRISRIVQELVDFSRPPKYEESATEVTDVIKTAMGIVKYDKRVKKVEFKSELDPNLPKVNIVPDQLLQVFVNILINSLDAIEGNGIISVKSYHDDKNIFIQFEDDGCGMEEEIINKIFDPFFTTKQVGKGTGLGLSVSYGIISKFGGKISAESVPGKLSRFIVQLPIKVNLR